MAERKIERMTEEQYFEWQLRQEKLYELVDGVPVLPLKMMSGATLRHDSVTVNLILELGRQLKGTGCRPMTSDVAVRIPKGNYRRPDITVDCGKPKSDLELAAVNPQVLVEVLSPSTLSFDRFRKLEEYKTVPSIKAVLLIDTEQPQITAHRRTDAGWIAETLEGLTETVDLSKEISVTLALKDVYDGVAFETG